MLIVDQQTQMQDGKICIVLNFEAHNFRRWSCTNSIFCGSRIFDSHTIDIRHRPHPGLGKNLWSLIFEVRDESIILETMKNVP